MISSSLMVISCGVQRDIPVLIQSLCKMLNWHSFCKERRNLNLCFENWFYHQIAVLVFHAFHGLYGDCDLARFGLQMILVILVSYQIVMPPYNAALSNVLLKPHMVQFMVFSCCSCFIPIFQNPNQI